MKRPIIPLLNILTAPNVAAAALDEFTYKGVTYIIPTAYIS